MGSTTSAAPAGRAPLISLRQPHPQEAGALDQIAFDSFRAISDKHAVPLEFPTVEAATGLIGMGIAHPAFWGVVAECDGLPVGSNFLDERDAIRGVGPVTVVPPQQGRGIGRLLMKAVLDPGRTLPAFDYCKLPRIPSLCRCTPPSDLRSRSLSSASRVDPAPHRSPRWPYDNGTGGARKSQ